MIRQSTTRVASLASILALTAACSSSNDGSVQTTNASPPLQTSAVRFIHASPDAPDVNVVGPLSTLAADLTYKEATQFLTFQASSVNVRVDGILPGGAATVIGPLDLPLPLDTEQTVIAVGDVAAIDAIVLSQPIASVPAGSVEVQVVHAAPNAPQVDVYVTAPGADLTQEAPIGSFAFAGDLGPLTVPAADYQIRVTLPGAPGSVVFDSGTVTLPSGADLLVLAVENTGPGASPISLVVADGTSSFEILDTSTPARIRVIHASPDAPAVDVIVNDDFANPLLSNVPYPVFSSYLEVPAGTYNVKVTPAGNPGVIVIDADLDLAAGRDYSVYATDVLASISPLPLSDDNRDVATEAKVRLLHLAPGAGLVDVYVTAVGADISTQTPAITGFDFGDDTGYLGLAGGSYDVTVTAAGTTTAAIGPATITLSDGGVYTAAARDAAGGGAPFGLILLDDFNP